MIRIAELSKKYGDQVIFDNCNFEFPDTGLIAIVGSSGSGKSTLLNLISGIEKPDQGSILVLNQEITNFTKKKIYDFRLSNYGYVFQTFNLLESENGFNNVKVIIDSNSNNSERYKKRKIKTLFKTLDIEKLAKKKVNRMSGGEKQRVAIARALINNPSILLCDEPTGALDDKNSQQIMDILHNISQTSLVIIVTHDKEKILNLADQILTINEGKIICTKKTQIVYNEERQIQQISKLKSSHLSLGFKIRHSITLMKEKKIRTLVSNVILSISLTGIGTSFILVNSVNKSINQAMDSLTNGKQILLKSKNEQPNPYSNVYGASYADVIKIKDKYNDSLNGIGVNYAVNYEDFFKDRNKVYVVNGAKRFQLAGTSARHFNEYKWYDNSIMTFPHTAELTKDDIVLGLPYDVMSNICFEFGIKRNYSTLGELIKKNPIQLTLEVSNSEWQYDDEQVFNVLGITSTNSLTIYHSDHLWNEYVFEEHMRFPSNDGREQYFPWEMEKLYYLDVKKDVSTFLNTLIYDEYFYDYVFQKSTYQYLATLCNSSKICGENRIFVYLIDRSSIRPSDIKYIKETYSELSTFLFTTNYSYSSYSSNLLSGFSKNFFASFEQEKIDQAIDAETSLTTEDRSFLELPEKIVCGNYLNGLNGGLKFSTKFDGLISGREPTNDREIVISNGLARKLSDDDVLGQELIFAGQTSESIGSDNVLYKEYQTAKAVVVGICDQEKDYLYHNDMWTISFFRDCLGVDSFSLIPTGVIFELNQGSDVDYYIKVLNKTFPDYIVTSPQTEIQSSLNTTLDYAQTIILIFSISAFLISLLLLGSIVLISVNELKDEIRMFNYVGIAKNEVFSMISIQSLIRGLIAFLISTIEVVVIENILSISTTQILHQNSFNLSISFEPILVIFLCATFLPILVSRLILFLISKRKDIE